MEKGVLIREVRWLATNVVRDMGGSVKKMGG
jgi:hypothetical protein